MKINIAKSAGFCFGVKRALTIAFDTARSNTNTCMLGDIVHNADVVRRVEGAGIKKITRLGRGLGKTLLIRAHGAGTRTFAAAKKHGYSVIDATCPMVKEIHAIARELGKKGYTVIVIGDKDHDEVRGIIGQITGPVLVIDSIKNIPYARLKSITKAGIVVQSTQNIENVTAIVEQLRRRIPHIKYCDTICRPTRVKQQEIKSMPLENDVMVIIGSKKSANTQRLYEISKSLNKNSHWVATEKELKQAWFNKAQSVGVTAGASTPEETITNIIAAIGSY